MPNGSMTFGLYSNPKKKARAVKQNTYTVVSIRGIEEFFDGTYKSYNEARRVAERKDSYLSFYERKNGYRTEIWTNYDPNTGDVQTVHRINSRRH